MRAGGGQVGSSGSAQQRVNVNVNVDVVESCAEAELRLEVMNTETRSSMAKSYAMYCGR